MGINEFKRISPKNETVNEASVVDYKIFSNRVILIEAYSSDEYDYGLKCITVILFLIYTT